MLVIAQRKNRKCNKNIWRKKKSRDREKKKMKTQIWILALGEEKTE